MKNITFSFTLKQLVVFVLLIPASFLVFSFVTESSVAEENDHNEITLEDAQASYQNNKNSSYSFGGDIEGFSITSDMLGALNSVNSRVSPSGFRIYFGRSAQGVDEAIIVGTDAMGSDITTFIERSTSVASFAACPPVCDASSQITSNK